MKYTIECSYGEIIDKLTILEIKLSKCNNEKQKINIKNEYDVLKHHKQCGMEMSELYEELKVINQILWDYEDKIRIKSKLKEFDKEYISISEQIHIHNDLRYEIKKRISLLSNSYIVEEKIYIK
jgi:hypothetical protein